MRGGDPGGPVVAERPGRLRRLAGMSRTLVHLNLWVLGALVVIGIPLMTVFVQAVIRRLAPGMVEGEHNDVAGFLIAVVGVVYAVTLAFIVIVTWEEHREARDTVNREAGGLRSLYLDSQSLLVDVLENGLTRYGW